MRCLFECHAAHDKDCVNDFEATADRRWSVVAANVDRFARGEKLENIVLRT